MGAIDAEQIRVALMREVEYATEIFHGEGVRERSEYKCKDTKHISQKIKRGERGKRLNLRIY